MENKENLYFQKAKEQFLELKEILKSAGILDRADKDNFVSKVWGVSAYTPRIADEDIIDLDFENITATLTFKEEKPELSTDVEFFPLDGSEVWYEFDIESEE